MTISQAIKLSQLDESTLCGIQTMLKAVGFYKGELDGLYGTQTQQAWERFKRQENLDNLESIGPFSYARLLSEVTAKKEKLFFDWHNTDCQVSQYFTVFDVTKGDPRRIPSDPQIQQNILRLAKELDRVRESWGGPIAVTSWYRPSAVNKAIGGTSQSQHLTGKAADVYPMNGELFKFQDWLDKVAWKDKALGYGAKKGFVHLDLRPGRIRWIY